MDLTVLFTIICFLLVCLIPFLLMFLMSALFIWKVGPNQVMIVYGAGGTKVISGGSQLVLPRFQHAKYFSLELMSFKVDLVQKLYLAEQEVDVRVEAAVLIKVRTREPDLSQMVEQLQSNKQLTRVELLHTMNENSLQQSILRAVELFLDKSPSEREELIRLVIEGHLYGLIGQRTFEDLVKEPESIVQEMFKMTTADLDRMGLEMVSFTLKGIHPWPSEQASMNEANEAPQDVFYPSSH